MLLSHAKEMTMNDPATKPGAFLDPSLIEGYHAHVYYDPATRPIAERLRQGIGTGFNVQLGRWHDRPVGPHPTSMYQVIFAVEELPLLLPFLMLNREGLSILVHPVTGDDYVDHADFPLWLGEQLPLLLETLR